MPFVNQTDTRAIQQQFGKYEHTEEPSFGEVFDASVGQVFDEELSISSMLNREGFDRRNQLIDEKVKSGEIDGEKYKVSTTGRPGQAKASHLNYAKIAKDHESEDIRTDEILTQERNEILKSRRDYAQDVQERGSGLAQFTGGLTAYMLDPLNIATVGIAAPVTVGKGMTTLGRAMLTARNAAITEGALELGIQNFVYAHKQDIDSPYTSADALANIGMAATGAAALGGVVGGLAGWLDRVVKFADELPPSKDVEFAKESIKRLQATVKESKKRTWFHGTDKDFTEFDLSLGGSNGKDFGEYAYFTNDPEIASGYSVRVGKDNEIKAIRETTDTIKKDIAKAISKHGIDSEEVKALRLSLDDAHAKRIALEDEIQNYGKVTEGANVKLVNLEGDYLTVDAKGKNYSETHEAAIKEAKDGGYDGVIIKNSVDTANTNTSKPSEIAIVFDKNKIRSKFEASKDKADLERQLIENDIDFLAEMDARATEYAKPTKTADQYETPQPRKTTTQQTVTERERDILARQGISDNYHAELEEFNALENKILEIDGEQIDAGDLMKSFDDELEGLESVLTCVYKGAA